MRKTFLLWLFSFVVSAFILAAASSFYFQTVHSRNYTETIFKANLKEATKQLEIYTGNLNKISELTTHLALVKAHTLAEIIKYTPKIANSKKKIAHLAKTLDVDELHISNGQGILINSFPPLEKYKNFNMNSTEQSKEFLKAITDKKFELVQPLRENGAYHKLYQYAGVARLDEAGIIQIGYKPERLIEAMKLADIANVASKFHIGENGFLQIAENETYLLKDKKIPNITPHNLKINQMFFTEIEGSTYAAFATRYNQYTLVALLPEREIFINSWHMLAFFISANLGIFILIFILISWLLQRLVINGIYDINQSLAKITAGDLDEKVSVHKTEEFTTLSTGINAMLDSLKKAHAESKKKIEAELKAAQDIQLSALPQKFPPFPDHNEFQIYATMQPAKEVGGDFYDFFMLDEKHLAFLVADVSGKGIPAALFMMKTKALLKEKLSIGTPPLKAIQDINEILCENNQNGMFVTLFLAIVELPTGKLFYINAGHNPPLLKRAEGQFEYLKAKSYFVLGAIAQVRYQASELILGKDDRLFLYTDGITEALNPQKEFFGEKRLKAVLNRTNSDLNIISVLATVKKELIEFANNEEQSDDITMLIFHYLGEQKKRYKLEIEANEKKLPVLLKFLERYLAYTEFIQKILMASEEIFINISRYAYAKKTTTGHILVQVEATESSITLIFLDTGTPYNPLKNADPNLSRPASERPIGGLGIYMVKQLMDFIDYQYRNGMNILTLKKELK